eukprot:COSAG01_NODE_25469_length_744_cov_1.103876_1_plen_220_part_01
MSNPHPQAREAQSRTAADRVSQRVAERNRVTEETTQRAVAAQLRQMQEQLNLQRTAFGGVRAPIVPDFGVQRTINRSARRNRRPNRRAFEDALAQAREAADPQPATDAFDAALQQAREAADPPPYTAVERGDFGVQRTIDRSARRNRRPNRRAFEDALAQAREAADPPSFEAATDPFYEFGTAMDGDDTAISRNMAAVSVDPGENEVFVQNRHLSIGTAS